MRKILLLVFVLVSFSAIGQVVQFPTNYGVGYRRTGADTLLWCPLDTFSVPASLVSKGHLARKGTTLYYWNGAAWAAFAGGGGGTYYNSNVGSAYRLAMPNTNNVKTLSAKYGIILDSATSNEIGVKFDSATVFPQVRSTITAPTWQQTLTAGSTLTTNHTITYGTGVVITTVSDTTKGDYDDYKYGEGISYTFGDYAGSGNKTFLDIYKGRWALSSRNNSIYNEINSNLTSLDKLVLSSSYNGSSTNRSSIIIGIDSLRFEPKNGVFIIDSMATGGASADSVVVITSGGQLKKRNPSAFGGSQTWQQTLTAGSTLTGANTINGGDYNFTFGQMGLFTVSQNNKASVSGSNGTANVSPLTVTGGNGGATSYSTGTVSGGNAGSVTVTAGNGGDITGTPATGVGGTGGSVNMTAGDGGLGTTNGGTAGNINLTAGTGGGGTAGGTAGYVAIKGGFAGSTGNADGGNIYLTPGAKNGTGVDGHIYLGLSPSATVRGAATIGSTIRGDSLFNIKDGGLYADRGVRFPNTPSFADTTNYKPVVMNSSGTLYKATYWPGGGSSGLTKGTTTIASSATRRIFYDSAGVLSNNNLLQYDADGELLVATGTDNGAYKLQVAGDVLLNSGSIKLTTSANTRIDYNTNGIFVFANSDTYLGTGSSTYALHANGGTVYIGGSSTANSTLQTAGSFATGYVAKAVDYTATISDCVIEVTATGKTITLPTAASITGRQYTIKLTASGTGTVATTSSQTIDGSTTYSLSAQYKYVTVVSNGSNWIIIANN